MLTKYSFSDCVLWLNEVLKLYELTIHLFCFVFSNVVLHSGVLYCNTILGVLHSYCARYFMCYSVLIFVLIYFDLEDNCGIL